MSVINKENTALTANPKSPHLLTIYVVIFAASFFCVTAGFAQEVSHKTTAKNTMSSKSTIDAPGLEGNPLAIIVATPTGDTERLNTNPIGAWYYGGKWNIFNSNHLVMPLGATYTIKYFLRPGSNEFLHVVTKENLTANRSYINNDALNGRPDAQFQILQNHSPDFRPPPYLNPYKAAAAYSTTEGRWYIANINGEPLYRNTAYNIVVSNSGAAVSTNTRPPTIIPSRQDPAPIFTTPTPRQPAGHPVPVRVPIPDVTPRQISSPTAAAIPVPIRLPDATPRPTPERGWTLRDDFQPSIPPNSEILLFIHGMDSRAEEADDITKALFAQKNGVSAPPVPPAAPPTGPDPAAVAGLRQILQKYEGCVLEKYETVMDMINRHLDPGLSGLVTTVGLQQRDQIQCVAGNTCSRAFRQTTFAALQVQASRGDASNFEARLKTIIPRDCFDCSKHLERHTKHVHCTMDCGGNQGVNILYPLLSIGVCFETCKAGVDLVKLATDVINDVHLAVAALGGGPAPGAAPPGTIASNFSTVQFNSCANPAEGCPEQCDNPDDFSQGARRGVLPPGYFEPRIPKDFLDTDPPAGSTFNTPAGRNIGTNEGRLSALLRAAASDQRPRHSLELAAIEFAKGNTALGNAYADLSVTGRRAFGDFMFGGGPKQPYCSTLASRQTPGIEEAKVLDGCGKALDRAYRVANFLRTGQVGETPAQKAKKTAERADLGWIAVSGENDQPHRPVNVPSSDHPQYDIDVLVPAPKSQRAQTVKVRTRYTIAQSKAVNPGGTGKNLVIISVDLPTSGYTENLDYDQISPLSEIGKVTWLPVPDFQATGRTPVLDFLEDFIVRFVETVDRPEVPVMTNMKAVMGGSLGGNMTFRLGRRSPDVTWLRKFIVWSPASIWNSLGEGPDPLKHFGPRSAYEGADAARNNPRPGDRAAFFGSWDKPVLPLVIPMAQSDTWTSEYYTCKRSAVAAARLDRHETYNADFLAWHWRLGGEQLLFSHQTIDPLTNKPRYMSNLKPMLLACGLEDTVAFNDICPATQNTAPKMIATPGKALFLAKTGHSLDNERRTWFAQQIIEFLGL